MDPFLTLANRPLILEGASATVKRDLQTFYQNVKLRKNNAEAINKNDFIIFEGKVANICSSILNHHTVITKLSYKQFRFAC